MFLIRKVSLYFISVFGLDLKNVSNVCQMSFENFQGLLSCLRLRQLPNANRFPGEKKRGRKSISILSASGRQPRKVFEPLKKTFIQVHETIRKNEEWQLNWKLAAPNGASCEINFNCIFHVKRSLGERQFISLRALGRWLSLAELFFFFNLFCSISRQLLCLDRECFQVSDRWLVRFA